MQIAANGCNLYHYNPIIYLRSAAGAEGPGEEGDLNNYKIHLTGR